MANTDINRILCLFERPVEPVFMPKGRNNIAFAIPAQYLPERFQPFEAEIINRFCGDDENTRISTKEITLQDLSIPMELGRQELFSFFIPQHAEMAKHLINIFMNAESYDDLLAISACSRDRLNPHLFTYALSVAILHHRDTKNLKLPSLTEIYPGKFMDCSIFLKANEQANIVPVGSRVPVVIPKDYTANDLEDEHRIAYFREDIGANLHHWHWHLVYSSTGDKKIVDKDRRGELFFYMHHQILARYNSERLCNKLARVTPLNNFREPIPEAYFSKLTSLVTGKSWASRPSGLKLRDVNMPKNNLHINIDDIERWRDQIYLAIHKGEVTSTRGETIKLTEKNGIDILGNMIESTDLSPNRSLYGNIHNYGHALLGFIHDPDNRHLEPSSPILDVATSMRDPVFYRWHAFINDFGLAYKSTLPEYEIPQLNFPGIEVIKCQITTPNAPVNTLMTHWTQSDIDIGKGLDFGPKGDILVRVTHLNHVQYKYRIMAINHTNSVKIGTVRIFIGPQLDERGLPFVFRVQKELMIEMDKFTVTLGPGRNTIERSSTDSSVTIPYERTFRNLNDNSTLDPDGVGAFNYCGCGWPQHMLVPKGTVDGYLMNLFVMISNHEEDFVPQAASTGCSDAASFCGLRDRKYPDSRSMGYPFDRNPRAGVQTLSAFLTPNMVTADIRVNFTDIVKTRSGANVNPA